MGRAFYPTPLAVIREARRVGVSRRIPRNVLKSMKWGDVVYLGMKYPYGNKPCWKCKGTGQLPRKNTKKMKRCAVCKGRGRELGYKKGVVVFAYFYLDRIEGIQIKVQDLLDEGIQVKIVNVSGVGEEKRGCGFREVGGCYGVTDAEVEQLADLSDVKQVDIAGKLYVLPHPWPVLVNVKFSRGYRRFDHKAFADRLVALPKGEGRPEVGGTFKPVVPVAKENRDTQETMFEL